MEKDIVVFDPPEVTEPLFLCDNSAIEVTSIGISLVVIDHGFHRLRSQRIDVHTTRM